MWKRADVVHRQGYWRGSSLSLTASRQIWSVLLGPGACDFCGVGRGESWRDRLGECGEAAGLAVYRVYVPFILWTDITTMEATAIERFQVLKRCAEEAPDNSTHSRERVTLLKVLQTGESRGFCRNCYTLVTQADSERKKVRQRRSPYWMFALLLVLGTHSFGNAGTSPRLFYFMRHQLARSRDCLYTTKATSQQPELCCENVTRPKQWPTRTCIRQVSLESHKWKLC
jgi:RNase P subunit RPR2